MTDSPKKVALYARVSTEEQKDNFSIPAQFDAMRKYCADRGHAISGEYQDPGFSGASRNRPALNKMLADAAAKKFQLVLVYDLSRLTREPLDYLMIVKELRGLEIGLESVIEQFDLNTASGELMAGIKGLFNQFERKNILQKSAMGMRKRVECGLFSGGQVPYGYDYDANAGKLIINDAEAKWVRKMFEWSVLGGLSVLKIKAKLDAHHVPTKRSDPSAPLPWQLGTIHRILKNPVYKGEFSYNKSKEVAHRAKIPKPPSEWIRHHVPPIVSAEIFEKCQAATVDRRVYSSRNTQNEYLLQGLLFCKDCGRRIRGITAFPSRYIDKRTGRQRAMAICQYYRCPGRCEKSLGKGKSKCLLPHVMCHKLDGKVWNGVLALLENPQEIIEAAKRYEKEFLKERGLLSESLAEVNEKIQKLKVHEDRLIRAYEEGAIEIGQLQTRKSELGKQRQALLSEKEAYQDAATKSQQEAVRLEDLRSIIGLIKKNAQTASFAERQKIIRQLLVKVEISKTGEITFHGILPEKTLNTSGDVKSVDNQDYVGSTNSISRAHPREVFEPALRHAAASLILVHNHPSGDPSPSEEDRRLTNRLAEAGRLLGVEVLDHVVVSGTTHFSFQENGGL